MHVSLGVFSVALPPSSYLLRTEHKPPFIAQLPLNLQMKPENITRELKAILF